MTDTALPVAMTLSSGNERIFPTLTPTQIKRIAAHGQVRSIRSGEVLVEAGALIVPFFVVTAGGGGGGVRARRGGRGRRARFRAGGCRPQDESWIRAHRPISH